jgi:hypothetical protein
LGQIEALQAASGYAPTVMGAATMTIKHRLARLTPPRAHHIKLGDGGAWERSDRPSLSRKSRAAT